MILATRTIVAFLAPRPSPSARLSLRPAATESGGGANCDTLSDCRDARMISLGYGKFVKADRIYALVPLEPGERGEGRRTYVHVDGLDTPIVASRSERAILADVEAALIEAAGVPQRRRRTGRDQDSIF